MYQAITRWMIRRNVRSLAEGDIEPLLSCYADEAVLIFPGSSSWSGTYRGRAEIQGFLQRFVAVGLQGSVEDILVNGPPWRMRICVLFRDRAERAGTVIYENRAVLYARMRWTKITLQEDFEDTEKVTAFDRLLHAPGDPMSAGAEQVVIPGQSGGDAR